MRSALRKASALLEQAGVATARLDAELLLAHALGIDRQDLLLDPDRWLTTDPQARAFTALVARRAAHEPLAYLTGRREFWSLDFAVSPATLIPRPDSETLVEAGLQALAGATAPRILDLGTGSGCLLIALLNERRDAFGVGIDLDTATVRMAAANAERLGVAGRSTWLGGSWFAPLSPQDRFDLIVCNPPYIPDADIPALAPDVRDHEPRLALAGGPDGLAPYRLLLPQLADRLRLGGRALFEFGLGQGEDLMALANACRLDALLIDDLTGRARCLLIKSSRSRPSI